VNTWQIVTLVVLGLVLAGGIAYGYLADRLFEWIVCGGPLIAVVACLVIFIPIWHDQQQQWEQWCRDQGGHVTDHTSTTVVTTVGSNGLPGVGVGSETTYYCLSADGRVLDVR
jgi:hypothetical protein